MLETLRIQNLAVIDEAEIIFKPGLNILSGETGAGKSIIIQAISLLLGGRASADWIRNGCDEAVIEGLFDLESLPWMSQRLEKLGFNSPKVPEGEVANPHQLLIKRVVSATGRHRIYVNGELSTVNLLHQLGEGLIDLCGQHEHQSLIRTQKQLELLDRFGNLDAQAVNTRDIYSAWNDLKEHVERLKSASDERIRRADFLRFEIEELRNADLQAGEDESLQSEKTSLQTVSTRAKLAEEALLLLESSEIGSEREAANLCVLEQMRVALGKIKSLAQLDASGMDPIRESLERILAEVEDSAQTLGRYLDHLDLNPERLEQVQDRLSELANLRRKYGTTVDDMLATLLKLETELGEVDQTDARLDELQSEFIDTQKDLVEAGTVLSLGRREKAVEFGTRVSEELKELRMEDATLEVNLEFTEDLAQWSAASAGDTIQFNVRTNRGEALKPIGKIASGGELSRLMLAIRRVIADRGGIGVYLFDEIDAGIGGQTAFVVGHKLKSVSAQNQVICITHLPQVAAFANHHLNVQKTTKGRRVITEVETLDASGRRMELARMLGGKVTGSGSLSPASLKAAQDLLEQAKNPKGAIAAAHSKR